MATNPADVLGLPKPAWAARTSACSTTWRMRFLSEEIAPRYDEFEKNEMVDRESWDKAGAAGLLCASMPEEYGGSGGTFAHESAIIEAIGHVGVDGFGIGCTMRSSRPTSSTTARRSRRRNGCRGWRPAS